MRTASWTAGLAATALTTSVLLTGGGSSTLMPEAAAADGLTAFDDCEELAQWYRATALEDVTAYGLNSGYAGSAIWPAAVTLDLATTGVARTDAVANGDTGTNVQEAGVDEPDIAKTDGSLTYVIDRRELVVTDVTGEEPVELGRLELPRNLRGAELLLVDDRAVLFSSGRQMWGAPLVRSSLIHPAGPSAATMAVVDVADPTAMRIVSERTIEGSVVAAREHGGTVRLVVSSQPTFDFVFPGRRWDLPRRQRPAADELTRAEALAENRRILRQADAQAFLPSQRVDGGRPEPLLDCADITHPEEHSGLGTISVLTLDPQDGESVESTAVSANGEQVYSSTDRLYVATTAGGWWGWEAGGERDGTTTTAVHAFDVTGSSTSYVVSGEVSGMAPDRWSFSEHEGLLRVATTEQHQWRDVESTVTVLREDGDRLVEVGSVSGMGPGEQIESVRWFDDLAIVVTFEQTDPLYTVDLSDPGEPRVLGELKIPGFSAYLHPVGDDVLLGVGQDATRRGRTTGSQVSGFDLSDLTSPERVAALGLGRHRYSPVEEDPRAFTYLPELRIALVPVSGWRSGDRLAAVRVGQDGRLTHAGSLEVRSGHGLRALPLADGRVAVTRRDSVELVNPGRLES